MIKKFEMQGVHANVSDKLKAYTTRKIGGLDKYIPRQMRDSAHIEVHLKEIKSKDKNNCCCEVTIFLPQQTIVIKEHALNMYAAVDIVEAKLKLQLQKYKDKHASGKMQRHVFARLRRRRPAKLPEES
jgi:ribosomal subunit interface protein